MPTQHPRRIRLAAIQAVRTVGTRSFATRSERVPVVQPECENRKSRLPAKIANTICALLRPQRHIGGISGDVDQVHQQTRGGPCARLDPVNVDLTNLWVGERVH